jgi:hypothetical protein
MGKNLAKGKSGEQLLEHIRKGVERRFENMSSEEMDNFFGDMSAAELKSYSEMVFKQRPIDIDLERSRLSFSSSFEFLPSAAELDKKCTVYRLELQRVASELQIKRDVYNRFLRFLKSPERNRFGVGDFSVSLASLGEFVTAIDQMLDELFDYTLKRDRCNVDKEQYLSLVRDAISDKLKVHMDGVADPYEKDENGNVIVPD